MVASKQKFDKSGFQTFYRPELLFDRYNITAAARKLLKYTDVADYDARLIQTDIRSTRYSHSFPHQSTA